MLRINIHLADGSDDGKTMQFGIQFKYEEEIAVRSDGSEVWGANGNIFRTATLCEIYVGPANCRDNEFELIASGLAKQDSREQFEKAAGRRVSFKKAMLSKKDADCAKWFNEFDVRHGLWQLYRGSCKWTSNDKRFCEA